MSDIRSGDAASATLSKVWDFDMRDRETEFKDDLREASGVGKKRGRKVYLLIINDIVQKITLSPAWSPERDHPFPASSRSYR